MYIARNHYFISYKFLPTCILQSTRTEQLVNFRGIQNWWRHDDVIRINSQAPVHVRVHVRMLNLSNKKPFTTKAYDRRASGDCGTSGIRLIQQLFCPVLGSTNNNIGSNKFLSGSY